jgi:hypothetical protein
MSEHRKWDKSSPAYGYVTLTGCNAITVNPGEAITFNDNGSLKRVEFTAPSDTLIVQESGDYKIEFTLLLGGPASRSVYGLIINNSLVSKGLTNYGIQRQVDGANLELVGQAIIYLRKNSKINLRNIGTTSDSLIPFLDGRNINAASLTIEKLS